MEQEKLIPVRLEDLEELIVAGRISRHAITQDILVGIRQLNEKNEIEPFLRDILPDPTNTPHTSTEVADILTTHVTFSSSGKPRLAAFVNKGKSYSKVTSEKVGIVPEKWRPESWLAHRLFKCSLKGNWTDIL
jgi:hypothetical protein